MMGRAIRFIGGALLYVLAASAQAAPVTNADVVAMLKAKMPDTVILRAIEQGEKKFDTSATALIALKNQGASEAVLNAILGGGSAAAAPAPAEVQGPGAGGPVGMGQMSSFGGLPAPVVIAGGTRIPLKRATQSAMRTNPVGALFLVSATRYAFDGPKSDTRLPQRQPTFEFSVPADTRADEVLALIKMKINGQSREAEAGKMGWTGMKSGARDKFRVALELAPVAGGSTGGAFSGYIGTLAAPLEPGEYAIVIQGQHYDFGVD